MTEANRYSRIIEKIFLKHFKKGATEVPFNREEIEKMAAQFDIKLPKNLGDLIYSFRYRYPLPESIKNKTPKGKSWIIRPAGRSKYCFVISTLATIVPTERMAEIKIPDATPGIIDMYALSDEQALLAKLRYNRLIDIFTGITCYSLQNHLRTAIKEIGQIETDEIYVGLNRSGAHYVMPVQAKGGSDSISIVQIEQDFQMCAAKFPQLICRPIAAQFMDDDLIALFEFATQKDAVVIVTEKHYRLVLSDDLTGDDLRKYAEGKI